MRIITAALLASAAVLAQTPPRRTFEVASIRPRLTPYGNINIMTSGLRLTAEAEMPAGLLQYAYHVKPYQIATSPALLAFGDTPYDIVARAPGSTAPTPKEFQEMLKSLLVERFQLRVHREQRLTRSTRWSLPGTVPSSGRAPRARARWAIWRLTAGRTCTLSRR